MSDIYHDPEKFGAELIGEHELAGESYEYDIVAVWRDAAGGFYVGTDSGCSCPSPFENYGSLDDATGPMTRDQAIESVELEQDRNKYDPAGFEQLVESIRAAV